jgi:GNAT superfamily N-acetyltransferase
VSHRTPGVVRPSVVNFREITAADLPALFLVRIDAVENRATLEGLASIGVTIDSLTQRLATTHKGWLCEIGGVPVGFAIGNGSNGELEVVAVLRAFEGKGIGRKLMTFTQDWLWSKGSEKLWLTTGLPPTRAYHLYTKMGWRDVGLLAHGGSIRMELAKSL